MILMFLVCMQVRTLVCLLPSRELEPPDVRSGNTSSGITRIDNKSCLPDNIRIIKGTMIGDYDDTISTLQMLVVKWHARQYCFFKCQCWYMGISIINMHLVFSQ